MACHPVIEQDFNKLLVMIVSLGDAGQRSDVLAVGSDCGYKLLSTIPEQSDRISERFDVPRQES
jgi:hypothetical protein